jgi:signal transduction histidine kinase
MNYYTLNTFRFLPFFFFISIFFNNIQLHSKENPTAINGVLDLRDYPLETETIHLSGEWEFYWDEHLPLTKPPQYLQVGTSWNGQIVGDSLLTGTGIATYRLKILFSEKHLGKNLALYLKQNGGAASRIWLDDLLFIEQGSIGSSKKTMIPTRKPELKTFHLSSKEILLTVEISNFYHSDGAFWYPPLLGISEIVNETTKQDQLFSTLFLGAIFIIAMYHFMIFFMRSTEYLYFYFGAFSLTMFLHGLSFWNNVLFFLFPKVPFFVSYFFSMLFILAVPLNLMYLSELFNEQFSKIFSKFILSLSLLAIISILLIPSELSSKLTIPGLILQFTLLFYILIFLLISFFKKKKYSFALFISNLILLISSLSDALSSYSVLQSPDLLRFGFFTYLFIQSFMIAGIYTEKFSHIEKISKELKNTNENLELLVEKKTNIYKEEKDRAETENLWKDKFISLVSHDLRSPLSSVLISHDMILNKTLSYDEILTEISLSRNIIINSLSMVKHLLSLSRYQGKNIKLKYKDIDFKDTILSIYNDLQFEMRHKNLNWTFNIPENIIVTVDPSLISECLRNIIFNSIKYSKESGNIEIYYRESKAHQIISIKDTGSGIPQDVINTIFSQDRVSKRARPDVEGFGLGLKLCNELIQLHGGFMEIESEVNKGTSVSLFIPANFLTILSFSTNEFSPSFTKEMHEKNILLLKTNSIDEFLFSIGTIGFTYLLIDSTFIEPKIINLLQEIKNLDLQHPESVIIYVHLEYSEHLLSRILEYPFTVIRDTKDIIPNINLNSALELF